MTHKKISKKYADLIHVSLFILVLLAFANYESGRKVQAEDSAAKIVESAPSPSEFPIADQFHVYSK